MKTCEIFLKLAIKTSKKNMTNKCSQYTRKTIEKGLRHVAVYQ